MWGTFQDVITSSKGEQPWHSRKFEGQRPGSVQREPVPGFPGTWGKLPHLLGGQLPHF